MLAAFLVQGIEFGVIARHDAMRRRKGPELKTEVDPPNCEDSPALATDNSSAHKPTNNHEHHGGGLHDIAGHAHGVAHAVTSEVSQQRNGTLVLELAAGILIYNSYVELIAMEMNQSQSFRAQKPWKQFLSFVSLYLGAAAMAVLALWA